MAGLDAGGLDRRVLLQRAGLVKDDYGDQVESFIPLREVWASMRVAPGRERLASAENAATAPVVFVIRWSTGVADLNAKDRVEYPIGSGKTFDIVSVIEIGRREGLEVATVRRAD